MLQKLSVCRPVNLDALIVADAGKGHADCSLTAVMLQMPGKKKEAVARCKKYGKEKIE